MAGKIAIERSRAGEVDAKQMPWAMLSIAWAAQTFVFMAQQAPATIAPLIQDDLHTTRAEVGLFAAAFSTGGIITGIPAGWLVDRVGSRPLLVLGPLLAGAMVALSSRAGIFWAVLLFVLFAGIGGGMISPAATKAVVSWFTPRTRGTAMGIKQTGTSLAGAIPAAVLPSLALAIGWRDAIGLVGLSIAAVGATAFVVYRDHPSALALPVAGKSRPTLRPVLANRNMQLCCLAAVCFTGVQMSGVSYFVLYFKESLGMAVTAAGALLAVASMSGVAARVGFGLASDRLLGGRRKVLLLVTGSVSIVCTIAFALLAPLLPSVGLVALVVVFGFVSMGWTGLLLIMVAELIGSESTGMGAAVAVMACNLGTVTGPPLFGFLVDQTGSYAVAWSVAALLSAVGVIAIQGVREKPARHIAAASPA